MLLYGNGLIIVKRDKNIFRGDKPTLSIKEIKADYTYFLICLIAPYLPKISKSSSAVILKGRFLTNIILFTSGGSLDFKKNVISKISLHCSLP